MHNKKDFIGQKKDNTVCYLSCLDVAKLAGKSRGVIFRDITLGRLPAIWSCTVRKNGRKGRAYLIHPNDAKKYLEKVKGVKRVNWKSITTGGG
ncbi:MAG: hypothetical protein WAW41_05340 [Methylobacter sp.]